MRTGSRPIHRVVRAIALLNLVLSTFLGMYSVLLAQFCIRGTDQALNQSNGDQFIIAISVVPILGSIGMMISSGLLIISASMHVSAWGLMLGKLWGWFGTFICATIFLVLMLLVTTPSIIAMNLTPGILFCIAIAGYAGLVDAILLARSVRCAYESRHQSSPVIQLEPERTRGREARQRGLRWKSQ